MRRYKFLVVGCSVLLLSGCIETLQKTMKSIGQGRPNIYDIGSGKKSIELKVTGILWTNKDRQKWYDRWNEAAKGACSNGYRTVKDPEWVKGVNIHADPVIKGVIKCK